MCFRLHLRCDCVSCACLCCYVLQCMHYSMRRTQAELISMVTGWVTGHVSEDAMENCQFAAKPSGGVHPRFYDSVFVAATTAAALAVWRLCFPCFVTVDHWRACGREVEKCWRGAQVRLRLDAGHAGWVRGRTEGQLQQQTTHSDSAHPLLSGVQGQVTVGSSFSLFSFSLSDVHTLGQTLIYCIHMHNLWTYWPVLLTTRSKSLIPKSPTHISQR